MSLFQSGPEISANLLNINALLVEKFSEIKEAYMYQKLKRIDRSIKTFLLDTAPQIHPKICTPLLEHTDRNSTKPLCSKISKIEVLLSALKSYVSCEISSLHSKVESISQSLKVTVKVYQERETKTNEIF